MSTTTYAVVDLEATGSNPTLDRIIQIGIVLIENEKIVSTYTTDVNPGRTISSRIQSLTGISNTQVENAPYFEDVADTIYSILKDTVFVAHNIYFDFPFLNAEFERVGLPPLKNHGIDTVELAQIFFPTLPSYRLQDIAESFHFVHENPHQADSDAWVTALLLIEIEKKIDHIPLQTLKQIQKLAGALAYDNQLFIEHRVNRKQFDTAPTLPNKWEEVLGIVLRKKSRQKSGREMNEHYPDDLEKKKSILGNELTIRHGQVRYMDEIYRHLTSSISEFAEAEKEERETEKALFIQAGTGVGKTLGYLFPLAFTAKKREKAVVSTSSIALQEQLKEVALPKLNKILSEPLKAVVLKGAGHFIHLGRFQSGLRNVNQGKQYQIFQMAVLVWLLDTETGDMLELNQTSYRHAFFEDVKHYGAGFIREDHPFYAVDFLVHQEKEIQDAQILLTNHAYLAEEIHRGKSKFPESNYLIVDEAHQLVDTMIRTTKDRFNFLKIKKELRGLELSTGSIAELHGLLAEEAPKTLLRKLKTARLMLGEVLVALEKLETTIMISIFKAKEMRQDVRLEGELLQEVLENFPIAEKHALEKAIRETAENFGAILEQLKSIQAVLSLEELALVEEIQDFSDRFNENERILGLFFKEGTGVQKKIEHRGNTGQLVLSVQSFDGMNLSELPWVQRFSKVVFTSATLEGTPNDSFVKKQLGFHGGEMVKIPSDFNFALQAKLFLPQIQGATDSRKMKESLLEIFQTTQKSTMVLFTSQEALTDLYRKMKDDEIFQDRTLFAQGITGSKESLRVEFPKKPGSVLLGLDTFLNGVDFPGDALEVLVLTKIPFDNPSDSLQSTYFDWMKQNNQ
ncbi:MAG: ribonuclease H-like domain-containing protein, partial [Streptococcaceae bacterium]|nr:ribonuclease H-like domain-containing protein [Streptococcaceae bacterium]